MGRRDKTYLDSQLFQVKLSCGHKVIMAISLVQKRTVLTQWLMCCATNRKVVGSISVGVTGIFH